MCAVKAQHSDRESIVLGTMCGNWRENWLLARKYVFTPIYWFVKSELQLGACSVQVELQCLGFKAIFMNRSKITTAALYQQVAAKVRLSIVYFHLFVLFIHSFVADMWPMH